jgi:dihydrolipoamide dehydrogenase
VTGAEGEAPTEVEARAILLATGSEPTELPGTPFDGRLIVTSTEALSFDAVPEHLVVAGAGYIGLELGSVWARLGAKVTVVELLGRIAPAVDGQVARGLARALERQGITFRLGTRVLGAEASGDRVKVRLQGDAAAEELECDRLLVAAGRKPLTAGLGLEEAGVELDASGRIPVDARYRTRVPSLCAIGDVIAGPMLAHKASAEGIAAVECLAGLAGEVRYEAIPSVIYTWPEVAGVGLTQDEAKERGIEPRVGTFPFAGNARARCLGETEGFAKVIAHPRTDRVLGVHILGPRASELIAECVLAIELGASAEDLARAVHGHPTFGEAVQEAARAASDAFRGRRDS